MSSICSGVENLQATLDLVYIDTQLLLSNVAGVQSTVDTILGPVLGTERHFHTVERWLGSGASDNTRSPYTIASGNNTYGSEVLLIDTGDTPIIAGNTKYDPHRIKIVDYSANDVYKIQFVYGTGTFASALSADQYSEIMVISGTAVGEDAGGGPAEVKMPRIDTGTKIWARCWHGTNGASLDFFLGLHEYVA